MINKNSFKIKHSSYLLICYSNLIFLLVEQPVDVVILISLFSHYNVFRAYDVEQRLSLRVLYRPKTGVFMAGSRWHFNIVACQNCL